MQRARERQICREGLNAESKSEAQMQSEREAEVAGGPLTGSAV